MNGEAYFPVDEQALLGKGRRRRCYRMPGDLCVKFYHDPSALPPKTRLGVRLDIVLGRMFRAMNVNYDEWQYHQYVCRHLPKDIVDAFPEHTEAVYCREKKWGIIETLILNADGTLPRSIAEEFKASQDPALWLRIYQETERLLQRFVEYGVCVFDPPNLLVQWTGDGAFRLRIADFEPNCRAVIPGLAHVGFYVRGKVRRRSERYLAKMRDFLIKKGVALPVTQGQPA